MSPVVELARFNHRWEGFVKALAEHILRNRAKFDWSIHGIGMMRLYLPNNARLHIWDSKLKLPNVSIIHTHPWSFKSTIIAGSMKQYRYDSVHPAGEPPTHMVGRIRSGAGAVVVERPIPTILIRQRHEWYLPGHSYEQRYDEIHETLPADGTVTLVERTMAEDADHAWVFWPFGTDWVDAKPRPAAQCEVAEIVDRALERWFK